MPAAEANFTALSRASEMVSDPSDMEATEPRKSGEPLRLVWRHIIQLMPAKMSFDDPPSPDRTLTAMMFAAFATPKVDDPAVPAVCVPWPVLSVRLPSKV